MQFEGDLLTYSPGKYFTIYTMIGSDIKTLVIDLGARTVHGLPFHLSTHLYYFKCFYIKLEYKFGKSFVNAPLGIVPKFCF